MNEVYMRLIDLPYGIRGMTTLDSAGDFNVYINARLCDRSQRIAYLHELRHIRRGDLYNDTTIAEAERIK